MGSIRPGVYKSGKMMLLIFNDFVDWVGFGRVRGAERAYSFAISSFVHLSIRFAKMCVEYWGSDAYWRHMEAYGIIQRSDGCI